MQQAIESALPKTGSVWQEYCMYQKNFLERVNRMNHASAGPGTSLRKRGIADIGQGRGKGQHHEPRKQNRSKRARTDFGGDVVLQLRDRIRRHGLQSGHYVQIENAKNEKWYMRVTDGKVLHRDTDDPVLAGALWCETNDVTKLSHAFPAAQTCEIRGIIDAGPMSKFK
jgi:hypothetical protein